MKIRAGSIAAAGLQKPQVCADYVGAMKTDLLGRIVFRTETQEDVLAELAFSYAEGACEDNAEFVRPEFPKLDSSQVIEKTDMFWPLALAKASEPVRQRLAGGESSR